MIWSIVFGFVKSIIGPVFDFLNKRVDANEQMHIVDTNAVAAIATGGIAGSVEADKLKAQIIMSQGKGSPLIWFMAAVLAPLVWHEWQVVLDSSRFVPTLQWAWGFVPYVWAAEHRVGSWSVAALPSPWDVTEMAIFQSLFIGASAATVAIGAIKAIKR